MDKTKQYYYEMECMRCHIITTYVGLPKSQPYRQFYNVVAMDFGNGALVPTTGIKYDYCEDCKLMTRQQLLSFDADPETYK
jgi:hypothetical protein